MGKTKAEQKRVITSHSCWQTKITLYIKLALSSLFSYNNVARTSNSFAYLKTSMYRVVVFFKSYQETFGTTRFSRNIGKFHGNDTGETTTKSFGAVPIVHKQYKRNI